jgi:D-tyrosyl-tRNA(Tyr) deacylase
MRLLVQRVIQASVEVEGKIVGNIGAGALVFFGVTHNDTVKEAVWLANKLVNLRVFEDAQGKMNQSLLDQEGSVLIVSQFTLYADCREGRRPDFIQSASPAIAIPLYEQFIAEVRKSGLIAETGIFGAKMKVSLVNDGPVTMMIERNNGGKQ